MSCTLLRLFRVLLEVGNYTNFEACDLINNRAFGSSNGRNWSSGRLVAVALDFRH